MVILSSTPSPRLETEKSLHLCFKNISVLNLTFSPDIQILSNSLTISYLIAIVFLWRQLWTALLRGVPSWCSSRPCRWQLDHNNLVSTSLHHFTMSNQSPFSFVPQHFALFFKLNLLGKPAISFHLCSAMTVTFIYPSANPSTISAFPFILFFAYGETL